MMQGYNAKLIDEEYRRKKMYEKKQRQNCKDKHCTECKFQLICEEVEERNDINGRN